MLISLHAIPQSLVLTLFLAPLLTTDLLESLLVPRDRLAEAVQGNVARDAGAAAGAWPLVARHLVAFVLRKVLRAKHPTSPPAPGVL
jgi:hypothetical protein